MAPMSIGQDLMAGPPPTHLPEDPAAAALASGQDKYAVAKQFPASPFAWAALAGQAAEDQSDPVTIYAYARVGYHRSLDMLRRNGWQPGQPFGQGTRNFSVLSAWNDSGNYQRAIAYAAERAQ